MDDTTGRGRDRYLELLEAQQPWQRLAQAMALTKMTRELALAGLRQRHPHAGNEELRARLTSLLYGREAARRWLGSVPDDAD